MRDEINTVSGGLSLWNVLQELDETAYWLELIGEAEIIPIKRLEPLHAEAKGLIAILVTIVTKIKQKNLKRIR